MHNVNASFLHASLANVILMNQSYKIIYGG